MSREKREFVCKWRIENFTFRNEARCFDEFITSPVFQAECFCGTQWEIHFCPHGYNYPVYCHLLCLNSISKVSNTSEQNNMLNPKSDVKDIIGYRFEILDINGVLLGSSRIQKYSFSNSSDPIHTAVEGIVTSLLHFPEDLAVRCVIMRMKDVSFSEDFNSSLENQRADEAKCDCECKTTYEIDRSIVLFQHLNSLKEENDKSSLKPFFISFTEATDGEIHVQLCGNNTISEHYVSCKISLLRQDGTVVEVSEETPVPILVYAERVYRIFSITKEIVNSRYYLKCDTKLSKSIRFEKVSYTLSNLSNGAGTSLATAFRSLLQDDLYKMLMNERFTDVTLKLENVLMQAHKALLAARSPVFSAMFDQDMLESQSGTIYLSDDEVETVKLFLKYIYTHTVEMNGYENAIKLMTIADKYQVIPLKENCSNYLKSVLSDENVCDVIAIADMLNQEDLKSSAMAYIKGKSSKILSTSEWTQWLRQNLELAAEIVATVSTELVKKDSKSSSS